MVVSIVIRHIYIYTALDPCRLIYAKHTHTQHTHDGAFAHNSNCTWNFDDEHIHSTRHIECEENEAHYTGNRETYITTVNIVRAHTSVHFDAATQTDASDCCVRVTMRVCARLLLDVCFFPGLVWVCDKLIRRVPASYHNGQTANICVACKWVGNLGEDGERVKSLLILMVRKNTV